MVVLLTAFGHVVVWFCTPHVISVVVLQNLIWSSEVVFTHCSYCTMLIFVRHKANQYGSIRSFKGCDSSLGS